MRNAAPRFRQIRMSKTKGQIDLSGARIETDQKLKTDSLDNSRGGRGRHNLKIKRQ